ncbi:uncharacterized protein ASCRUDRAFT_99866 [Ascoidea rubescens DSM 1968]|uniref:Uncharacterized protein n=1 Tax=Ascoidea rubescens DSM 1968 TaxID=1344418 RepID=A0A1D2VQN7_9ASCO|nr:hypothetical protein ASCRUDRAFT_99866 [Ascoidea rubescens DSM 1968]ODV63921.1 hypothetical protein ASCRUDRAFT_99866 [Ascoidea rubescens DSM 1968]
MEHLRLKPQLNWSAGSKCLAAAFPGSLRAQSSKTQQMCARSCALPHCTAVSVLHNHV